MDTTFAFISASLKLFGIDKESFKARQIGPEVQSSWTADQLASWTATNVQIRQEVEVRSETVWLCGYSLFMHA